MKHLIALTIIAFVAYFGWHYLPEEFKVAAREFRGTHFFKVICLIFAILFAFSFQATFGSGKIF